MLGKGEGNERMVEKGEVVKVSLKGEGDIGDRVIWFVSADLFDQFKFIILRNLPPTLQCERQGYWWGCGVWGLWKYHLKNLF